MKNNLTTTQRFFAMLGILIAISIGALAFSVINTSLATIKKDLNASVNELQWIMNIMGIFISSTLVTMGRLADVYGRKRIYMIGILGMGVGMLGNGLAPNATWIIFFQALVGLSAAILLPISQALMSHLFPEEDRSKAISIWAAVIGVALATGPLLSGIIISTLGWRWIFLINVPFAAISFLLILLFVPESRSENESTIIDWSGALLLTLTIASFVLAVVQGSLWRPSIIVSLYIISAISLVLLLIVEKKVKVPIIREDLFTNKRFIFSSLGNFCMIFFVWACFFLIPLYLQTIRQFSPMQAGLLMLFVSIPLAVMSPISGKFYRKFGPKILMMIGFALLILSTIVQMQFDLQSPLVTLILATLFFGLAWGFIWGPSTTAAISTISKNYAGIASGTFNTIQEIGGTVGLAITATVFRMHKNFIIGYHDGLIVLLFICMIGMIATFLMPRHAPTLSSKGREIKFSKQASKY